MANTLFSEKNKAAWIGVRPGVYGEQIAVNGEAVNQTVVLYTVPAGKTLLVFNTRLSVTGAAGGGGNAALKHSSGVPADIYSLHHCNVVAPGNPVAQTLARFVPYEIPAGHLVRLTSSNANTGALAGFEGLLVTPAENT